MCQAEVSLGLNSPDPLVREAHVMAHDYIAYVIGGRATHPRSRGAEALRHAGDELLLRFPIFFRRWPRVFRDVSETTAWPTLMALLDQHFFPPPAAGRRPELAWSAVLSVYVLAGQMALHCRERGMLGVLPQLQEAVGAYVERVVCPEIRDRGGWSGFVRRFGPKADLESQVRSACCWALLLLATSILSYGLWKRMA